MGYGYVDGNDEQLLAESWDGTDWSIVPMNAPNGFPSNVLWGVTCLTSSSCIAVGQSSGSGGAQTLVESWDGTSWSIVPSPNPTGTLGNALTDNGLNGVACLSSTSCIAVGSSWGSDESDGSDGQTLIESWDGTSWSVVPSPNIAGAYSSSFDKVACLSATSCIAVGGVQDPPNNPNGYSTLVESWDGTSWSIVPSPNDNSEGNLYDVACVSSTDCTAVGYGYDQEGLVESWDGTSWSIVPSPSDASGLFGISCPSSTACFAVGGFDQAFVETGTDPIVSISSSTSAIFTPGAPNAYTVTTSTPAGQPIPSITEAGTLPSDLTFTDNGNGTASLTGTPGPADAGSYPITITASNGVSPDASQDFTLTVLPIGITTTSLPSGTTGEPYSAGLSVSGGVAPNRWSVSNGTLPNGLSLNPSTGAIKGTPTTIGSSSFTVAVTDSSSPTLSATSELTITIAGTTPTINVTPSANPAVSGPVIYSVSVTGAGPTPTGLVTVSDGHGGTCSVTLVTGAAGCAIAESATNSPYSVIASYSGDSYYLRASGSITETVEPAIANVVLTPSSDPANQGSVTYTVLVTGNSSTPTGSVVVSDGQGGSCSVILSQGLANCAIDESTLSSPFTITATYGGDQNYGTVSTSITDAIGTSTSSGGMATATVGQTTVTGSGEGNVSVSIYPGDPVGPPSFTSSGVYFDVAASQGNSFTSQVIQDCDLNGGNQLLWWNPSDNGGIGAWEPVVGDPGPIYSAGPPACLTATLDANSSPTISQLTGTVIAVGSTSPTPSFTSGYDVEVQAGGKLHFPVSTSGFPSPAIREIGALPKGVTFHDNGNGTGLISGTAPTTEATYPITLAATNSNGTATQSFFLVVGKSPTFLSPASTLLTKGKPSSFVVRTSGSPTPLLTKSGTLPNGLTFTEKGNGTAVLTGSPTTVGTYSITITAVNGIGSGATQHLTLTVGQAPVFTSTTTKTFTHGVKSSFEVVAVGPPSPGKITETGKLPTGLTFTSVSGGTGTLTGKTTSKGTFTLTFKVTNSVGTTSQMFRLVVK